MDAKIILQKYSSTEFQHFVLEGGHRQEPGSLITVGCTFLVPSCPVTDAVLSSCADFDTRRSGSIDSMTGTNTTPWKNCARKDDVMKRGRQELRNVGRTDRRAERDLSSTSQNTEEGV